MKYMTFNSSCTYAGIANMLEACGIDKEDYEIALGMKLPYLFDYDSESQCYVTGASLQNKTLFNLYLNPIGAIFEESLLTKNETIQLLANISAPSMIGILLEADRKHAVVFSGMRDGQYVFLNNKRKDSNEPDQYIYDANELCSRIEEPVSVGWITRGLKAYTNFTLELSKSVSVLHNYRKDLLKFCETEQTFETISSAVDSLFRPLILDGLAMMQLIGNDKISSLQSNIQSRFMAALRKRCPLSLKDELPVDQVDLVFSEYITLVNDQINQQ